MSFHLQQLTLRNWLAYEGEVTASFGNGNPGHNLWVVYGLNGFGKTSLLRATQWLFHDVMPDRHINSCFNKQALENGDHELSVSALFSYDGHTYHLVRRAKHRQGYPKTEVELTIDGEVKKDAVEDTINQIVPKECQQFFFFDGLEIEKYAQTHSKETREAIETVLGIPEVRNLNTDLSNLIQELEHERDQLLHDQESSIELQIKKDEAEAEIEAHELDLKNQQTNLDSLTTLIVNLNERANNLERKQDDITRLQELQRRLADLGERINNYDKELMGYLNVVSMQMVLPILTTRVNELQTQQNKAEIISQKTTDSTAQSTLIQKLLEEADDCICGRQLDDDAKAHLQQVLQDLSRALERSKHIAEKTGSYKSVLDQKSKLEKLIAHIEAQPKSEEIQDALSLKYKLQIEREESELEIERLKKKLEGSEDADVRDVFKQLADKKRDREDLENQTKETGHAIDEAKKRLAECQKELNDALRTIGDKSGIAATLENALGAQAVTEELVEEMLRLRRVSIQTNMTNVLRMVTNKPKEYDRIEINEDFSSSIVTVGDQAMRGDELSAGEKEVLAFSFIAGLNQSTETNAPLVMDTPFGHLDIKHRDGLLEALPKLPCQVILLATDRDLPEAELPGLKYCLGGVFDIFRDEQKRKSYVERREV